MNEQLNSAQVQAAQKMAAGYIELLQLRKWAVEQAVAAVCSPAYAGTNVDISVMAKAIYDFVNPPQRVEGPVMIFPSGHTTNVDVLAAP